MRKKNIYLKVSKEVPAPLEKVWEKVALGFGEVARYNPAIEASRFDSDQKAGVGTRRHCDTADGGYLKEEIVDWNEMENFTLNLVETSFPMATIESKFSFQKKGNNTLVTQEFWYRMKPPMGWLSGLMKGRMKKTLVTGLNGLADSFKIL